jgi:hypothetical protein
MLETNVDHDIILGKVKRQMNTLSITHQAPSTSRNIENKKTSGGMNFSRCWNVNITEGGVNQ